MKGRALLKAIPAVAVLPAVAAVPAMAMPTDPIIDLCERYIIAFDAWEAANAEEGEGNFDGPLTTRIDADRCGSMRIDADRCGSMRIDAEKIRLSEEIKATPISTAAGFAAYCRFVAVDNFMRDESEDFPDMHRWQWEKIKAWSEARALIGGAA